MNPISSKIPYMVCNDALCLGPYADGTQVSPGNHEAACMEFDGPGNIMTAYMNEDIKNGTANETDLTYYSCPPSQR